MMVTYMHGNGSLYRGIASVVASPLRRYVSSAVSTTTPIAPRCFSNRPVSCKLRVFSFLLPSGYLPSSSASAPVTAASSVTVFGSSLCTKILNTPRSMHASIAAKEVG